MSPARPRPDEAGLRIDVLGPVLARSAGGVAELGAPRQRAVLAVLALRAGRVVTRGELIDAVWGADPPVTADGSVYTYVSGLRRGLRAVGGDEALRSDRFGYLLDVDPEAVDATAFANLSRTAKNQVARTDLTGALASLNSALGLWRADVALAGLPGPFAENERRRLSDLRLAAVEARAALAPAIGDPTDVIGELTPLVRDNPLRESLRAQLMIALYRSGRHAEALDQFREAERVLAAELGVGPGAELVRVRDRVLSGDPAPALLSGVGLPRPASASAGPPESGAVPLVGRDAELDLLRRLMSDASNGRGTSVWIEGEPGSGKSRLLTEALAGADARWRVAYVTADQLARCVPLQVVFDCLAAAMGNRLAPDAPAPARLLAAQATEYLMGQVRELCRTSPAVLVIDDLHWADTVTLLFWRRLSALARELPLLVVAAVNPMPARGELALLRRDVTAAGCTRIDLPPLNDADVDTLFERLIGTPASPATRAVLAGAGGNARYVTELVAALRESGDLRTWHGPAEITGPFADRTPPAVVDAVERGLATLSEGSRNLLRSAAILGDRFTVRELGAVVGRPPADIAPLLSEAMAATALVEVDGGLAFRQPLVRKALHDTVAAPIREAMHRHAVEVLIRLRASVDRVAAQLIAVPGGLEPWAVGWAQAHYDVLADSAPLIAATLAERLELRRPA